MGVIVVLRRSSGEDVRGLPDPAGGTFDAAGDFDRWLSPPVDSELRALSLVDADGTTTLGSGQVALLLADVAHLLASDLKPTERRGLERLRALAERCAGDEELSLWFIGD